MLLIVFLVANIAMVHVVIAPYPPRPPTASFFWSPPEPYVNVPLTFDASASSPDGGEILSYKWNFGDGNITSTSNSTITHVYKAAGNYIVSLNVTDSEGLWGAISKPIEILPPSPPTAIFSWTPPKPYANQTVTFDARNSKPGWNGTDWPPIVKYKWNFGDGNITSTSNPTITHVYKAAGNFTVSLNVTDSEGLWDSTSRPIEVTLQPGLGPWDINGDGVVDSMDVLVVGLAFGSKPGDPNWDIRADLTPDNLIDSMDVLIVGIHFGEGS